MAKNHQTQVLKDLNATLQVHAERIRLQPSDWLVDSTAVKRDKKSVEAADSKSHASKEANKPDSARSVTKTSRSRLVAPPYSGRSIRDYRVGYTWNRGGRLKELRIRHLARKFSRIWKKRVFGRVLPSEARSYYSKVLYRKVFTVLYDDWWNIRKEWRLQLRAECHDRYRLHSKCCKAWKEFVCIRREDNSKLYQAESHASENLLRKCLFVWQIYTEQSKVKSEMKKRADNFHINHTLRKTMEIWIGAVEKKRVFARVEEYASRLYQLNLQSRTWRKWINQQRLTSTERNAREKAEQFYTLKLKSRVWKVLCDYHSSRQRKLKLKNKAMKYRRQVLLKCHLQIWYQRLRQSVQIQLKEDTVVEMGRLCSLRRAFIHWSHYLSLRKQKAELLSRAENHHNYIIKEKCVEALRHAVVLRNLKIVRESQAAERYQKNLLRRYWRRWMERTEEAEEDRLYSHTELARQHYRERVVVRAIDHWKEYTEEKQMKKKKQQVACIYHLSSLLPKCFQAWGDYVSLQKWKDHIKQQSAAFHRQNVEAKYFYTWRTALQKKMDIRVMERMAEMHCQEKLVSAALGRWISATNLLLDDYENTHLACEHHQLHLRKKIFTSWRMVVCQAKQEQEELERGEKIQNHLRLKKYLGLWLEWIRDQKSERRKCDKASQHYSSALCHRVLTGWLKRTKVLTQKKEMAEYKYNEHRLTYLSEYLERWKLNAKLLHSGRQQVEVFTHKIEIRNISQFSCDPPERRQSLIKQVFTAWREHCRKKLQRRLEENQKIDSLREKFNRIHALTSLRLWRRRHEEKLLSTLKYNQAIIHHDRKSLTRTFSLWQQGVQLSKQAKVLKEQAGVVSAHLTLGKAFYLWKLRLSEAALMKEKTYRALLHWSLTVERKCLIGWYCYMEKRKQKKALYSQAFEQYKDQLLLAGVRQWFTVADRMAVLRERIATDQYAQHAHQVQTRVQKCFYHWRAVTQKRKELPPSQPPPNLQPQQSLPLQTHPQLPLQSPPHALIKLNQQSVTEEISKPAPHSPPKPNRRPAKSADYRPLTSKLLHYDISKPQQISHMDAVRKKRPPPKRPSYLMASLEREGLWKAEPKSTFNADQVDNTHRAVSETDSQQTLQPVVDSNSVNPNPLKPSHSKPSAVLGLLKPSDITVPPAGDNHKSPTQGVNGKENRVPSLLPPSAFTAPPPSTTPETQHQSSLSSNDKPEIKPTQTGTVQSSNEYQSAHEGSLKHDRLSCNPCAATDGQDFLLEIELIQEKLLSFKRNKRRLQQLKILKSQLTECLSSLPGGQAFEVQQEIKQLDLEINDLSTELQNSKEECHLLSHRLDQLTEVISTDFPISSSC